MDIAVDTLNILDVAVDTWKILDTADDTFHRLCGLSTFCMIGTFFTAFVYFIWK